jgi:DNA-binding response OmpR family regulator
VRHESVEELASSLGGALDNATLLREFLKGPMSNASGGLYTFGFYRLDATSRILTRSGAVVTLAPKTFGLLVLMAESGGRLLRQMGAARHMAKA